jgi:hypothetical protein
VDALTLAADRLEGKEAVDPFVALRFYPNPGPQTRFLSLPDANIDVLYGGAAGGSKSTSLLAYALRACYRHPGLQAFWFRRSFPELEQSVLRMLARYQYARALGARWNGSTHELRFSNGSVLTFGHAKNLAEASALLSAEINLLILDERTTIPPEVVGILYTRVRSGVAGVPCLGVRSATNPGGIGHAAVKRDYIDATNHGAEEIPRDANGRRRVFIQARSIDTPQLGQEYRDNLSGLDENLRKAYLDGDWDVFVGQMFKEFRRERHVMTPITLPETWRRYIGVDWGWAAPWAVVWCAQDEDGRLWFYRERYATQVRESEQARQILEAEAGEHIVSRFADDAMWASRGEAKPIAAVYAENGVHLTPAGKGPGSRIIGWQRIHSFLAEGPACPHHRALGWVTCPMAHFFDNCPELIRELSGLPHATTGNPEDADTNASDHAPDAVRYIVINIGGGPEFLMLDAIPDAAALPVGEQFAGVYAVRPAESADDWWNHTDDDDGPRPGGTVIAP